MSDKKCKLCKLHVRHLSECDYCETCCSVTTMLGSMKDSKRKRWINRLRKSAKKG